MTRPLSWVIGAGGLLGSNVSASLARRGDVWQPQHPVSWQDPTAPEQIDRAARNFLYTANGRPWQIAWCAGSGVIATDRRHFDDESVLFARLLDALSDSDAHHEGALFVASSAGGVYAGSRDAPFSESHQVKALSPYGEAKIALERRAAAWGTRTGTPVLLGRIANLYGPGQDLRKQQGLISQLCRAQLLRKPVSLFVPLDTVRDYIFAADCGELVAASLERVRAERGVQVKVLASQQAISVGAVVNELRRIFKRAPHIVYGASPTSRYHVRDLRLRSIVWTDLDRRPITPLPAGMGATLLELHRALRAGALS